MTSDDSGDKPLSVLPDEVVERILQELPTRGEKVVGCIQTAAELIKLAVNDERGLRLAESIGYNLREALDAVVEGRDPGSDLLPAVFTAWEQYREQELGSEEKGDALRGLERMMERLSEKRERSSIHAARLLTYLRDRTGVEPFAGKQSPIGEYNKLRTAANRALHAKSTLDASVSLYDRTVTWFVWMFTPPDAVIRALSELAAEPWSGPEQIEQLRKLVTDTHHMRFFCGQLADARWLIPLYEARFLTTPQPDEPWPAVALLDSLGRIGPVPVAEMLKRLLTDSKKEPDERQLSIVFEVLRVAAQLGAPGHAVVISIPRHHYRSQAVRSLALSIVRKAPADDPVVMAVAKSTLDELISSNDRYYLDAILSQIVTGLDSANVADRTRGLAVKVRVVANMDKSPVLALDRVALSASPGNERWCLAILLYYFARVLARARELGTPSSDLLTWTQDIAGETGERLTCRILAEADDVPLEKRATHIAQRVLASRRVTGDDRDLVAAIMRHNPGQDILDKWAAALGTPSEPLSKDECLPDDWERAWRWSIVLPSEILAPWQEAIAGVTARYGPLDPTILDQRREFELMTGRSPYGQAELEALPVLEAAAKIGNWRPDATSEREMITARELARTLEAVVKASPEAWSREPTTIVEILREPVHVLHYFDALKSEAKAVADTTPKILDAAAFVREARWEPIIIGDDDFDFEPNWDNVDTASVELAAALGRANGYLNDHLDAVWTWALDLFHQDQGDDEPVVTDSDSWDALHDAINSRRGQACESVLELAEWEFRQRGQIGLRFLHLLDEALVMSGQAGREFRAILARSRRFLEIVVPEWMEENAVSLFGDGAAGAEAFALTLKYSQPTHWFLERFRDKILAAARDEVESAVRWLLTGVVKQEPGYKLDVVVSGLKSNTAALADACGAMPRLVQGLSDGSVELEVAVEFWQVLLNSQEIPSEALIPAGNWAFVTGLGDDRWSRLSRETLERTDGHISFATEVADRCAKAQIRTDGSKIFRSMLGRGEPWKRSYIADKAFEMLTASTQATADAEMRLLRTKLIDLGYHRAVEIDLGDD